MNKKRENIETLKNEIIAKHPGGRPLTYDSKLHPLLVKALISKNYTNVKIIEEMGISEKTFYTWKKEHVEFSQGISEGELELLGQVKRSLYHRAIGHRRKAEKIFQFQGEPVIVPYTEVIEPDIQAIKYILNNRDPENWSEKQNIELGGKDGAQPIFEVRFVEPEKSNLFSFTLLCYYEIVCIVIS